MIGSHQSPERSREHERHAVYYGIVDFYNYYISDGGHWKGGRWAEKEVALVDGGCNSINHYGGSSWIKNEIKYL